ncbi:MAG: hypothetical protein EPGJADBJ_04123 [Saprospiraceae bacterium]|nr:hypothetical protein [Saprospiraceae bacterium]
MKHTDDLSAILAGDRTALERLYREQFPAIRDLLRKNGGSEMDAKDVFQDAVLVVYQKAKQPDFQLTSQFSAFFYGICRNIWLNHRSKKSTFLEVIISEDAKYTADESSLEAEFLQVERDNLFWCAFRQLGEDCQKLLELFFQKLPMETIALQMGFGSEGYARRRKLQCKERLVELVKNRPEYRELLEV